MLIIGDVHGKMKEYLSLIKDKKDSIQVGDFGFGFVNIPYFPPSHQVLRGNHDCPQIARKDPNYLGDFGYIKEKGIFFVSGANSIDRMYRHEGIDWWRDEELSHQEFGKVISDYEKIKPEIVITHAAPESIKPLIIPKCLKIGSRTEDALEIMLKIHRPKLWCCGHYHKSYNQIVNGTRFVCLDELETMEIP